MDAMSITEAAESGDRRALLVALRTRLAAALDNPTTSARDLSSLSLRLGEVVKEIKALDDLAEQEPRRFRVVDGRFDASAI